MYQRSIGDPYKIDVFVKTDGGKHFINTKTVFIVPNDRRCHAEQQVINNWVM